MGLILAIDPSLTGTAVCMGDAFGCCMERVSSKPNGNDVAARVARYSEMVEGVLDFADRRPDGETFDAIYLEAYAFSKNDAGAKFIGEYGGILRWHLVDLSPRIFEVSPMTLKKFCTGAGHAKKDIVAAHLARRYNVDFPTTDEFDAFGLFRLALVAEGLAEANNMAEQEAANTVLGIKLRR